MYIYISIYIYIYIYIGACRCSGTTPASCRCQEIQNMQKNMKATQWKYALGKCSCFTIVYGNCKSGNSSPFMAGERGVLRPMAA